MSPCRNIDRHKVSIGLLFLVLIIDFVVAYANFKIKGSREKVLEMHFGNVPGRPYYMTLKLPYKGFNSWM